MPVIVRGYDTDDISQSRKKIGRGGGGGLTGYFPSVHSHVSELDISVLEPGNIMHRWDWKGHTI